MDLQTYFAIDSLLSICAAAAEHEHVKKTRKIVDGLTSVPQPERLRALSIAMHGLARGATESQEVRHGR